MGYLWYDPKYQGEISLTEKHVYVHSPIGIQYAPVVPYSYVHLHWSCDCANLTSIKTIQIQNYIELLTGWALVKHVCHWSVIIGSDNGLSPGWHPGITWTNADLLGSIGQTLKKSE